jgi:AmmeMemoRadiSam system protein A
MLDANQRRQLLQIARDSIAAVFAGRAPEVRAEEYDEVLQRPAGAFVTLTLEGDLRGCIGSIHPVAPLAQAVSVSALNAAFRDPRFAPLSRAEFARVAIEVSVMGPIETVRKIEEIEPGRDGLIITRGRNSGLLLPQVATEFGWDRETFLRQTCVKAGLAPESWKLPDCRIERFSAEVFGEHER